MVWVIVVREGIKEFHYDRATHIVRGRRICVGRAIFYSLIAHIIPNNAHISAKMVSQQPNWWFWKFIALKHGACLEPLIK